MNLGKYVYLIVIKLKKTNGYKDMKTGLITKADGSAYLEQERIKMVSAV